MTASNSIGLTTKVSPVNQLNDFLQILFSKKQTGSPVLKEGINNVQRSRVLMLAKQHYIKDDFLTYILKYSYIIREHFVDHFFHYEWILNTKDNSKPNIYMAKTLIEQFETHKNKMAQANAMESHLFNKLKNSSMDDNEEAIFKKIIDIMHNIKSGLPESDLAIDDVVGKPVLDYLIRFKLVSRIKRLGTDYLEWSSIEIDPMTHINTKFIRAFIHDIQRVKDLNICDMQNIKNVYPSLFGKTKQVKVEKTNSGWTGKDELELKRLIKEGYNSHVIAGMIGRTTTSVNVHTYKMGIKPNPGSYVPSNKPKTVSLKAWTPTDNALLTTMLKEKYTIKSIAARLNRTPNAIWIHIYKLNSKLAKTDRLITTGLVNEFTFAVDNALATNTLPVVVNKCQRVIAAKRLQKNSWTQTDIDLLIMSVEDGLDVKETAAILNRTVAAVYFKLDTINKNLDPITAPPYKFKPKAKAVIADTKETEITSDEIKPEQHSTEIILPDVMTKKVEQGQVTLLYSINPFDLGKIKENALKILGRNDVTPEVQQLVSEILTLSINPTVV